MKFMVLFNSSPLLNVLKLFHFFFKSQLMNWLSQKVWILNLQPASKSPRGFVKSRLLYSSLGSQQGWGRPWVPRY